MKQIFLMVLLTCSSNYGDAQERKYLPCDCIRFDYQPLCGQDGRDYDNPCEAKCQGAPIQCRGLCPCQNDAPGCDCPSGGQQVCGFNGLTYANSCQARCKKQSVRCTGSCPCLDECPSFNSPVCGSNGQTYRNSCWARKAGMTVACNRQCPCPNCHECCRPNNNPRCRLGPVDCSNCSPKMRKNAQP